MQRMAEQFAEIPEAERQPEKKKEPAKPAKPAAAAPPAKPKRVTPPAPVPLTAAEIASAAAEGATRALAAKPKDEPAAKKDDDSTLSPQDKKLLPILERMEVLQPDQYKGLAKKYREALTKEGEYIAKWQAEHPGQEFDKEADEHTAFYDANDVDWTDEDFTDAVADIKAEAKVAEKLKPVEAKLSDYDRQQRLNEAAPKIGDEQLVAAKEFWKHMGDDFQKIFNEQGLDEAEWKRISESDPVAHEIRLKSAHALNIETTEMYKLMNGLATFDEKNPIHVNLADFATKVEAELSAKPAAEQLDAQGRQFLPADKYYKLPKAEKDNYWTPSMRDLMAVRASELAANANKIIAAQEEKFNKWAESRGLAKKEAGNGAAAERQQQPPQPEPEPLETDDGKPISPTSDDQSRLAAVKNKGGAKQQDALSARIAENI